MRSDLPARRAVPYLKRYALSVALAAFATWLEVVIARSPATLLALTPSGLAIAIAGSLGGFGPAVLALILSALSIHLFVLTSVSSSSSARPLMRFCSSPSARAGSSTAS